MYRLTIPLFFLGLAAVACQPDYRPFQGAPGDPCRSDSECDNGLSCLSFTCTDPDGATTPGNTLPPEPYDVGLPDTNTGFDTGPLPDASDTTPPPPPDTGRPDVPPDPDAGQVCFPREQSCRDDRTLQRCRDDGSGFVTRTCAEDQICEVDRCVRSSQLCRPNEVVCSGNDILRCNRAGTGFDVLETCNFDEVCIQGQCEEIDEELPNISLFEASLDIADARPGDALTLFLFIANTGPMGTGSFTCSAWLSTDSQLDPNRDFPMEFFGEVPDLPPFSEFPGEVPLTVPDVPDGRYNVILECDVLEPRVVELSEDDNLVVATPSLNIQRSANVCEEDPFEFGEPNELPPGEYILGLCDGRDEFVIEHQGGESVQIFFEAFDGQPVRFSVENLFTGEVPININTTNLMNGIELGGRGEAAYLITIARPAGADSTEYFLGVDYNSQGQNAPDLVPGFGFIATDSLTPGRTYEVEGSIFNAGDGFADFSEFGFFLSFDAVYQPNQDFAIFLSSTGPLGPGEERAFFDELFADEGLPEGFYQVLFVVDPFNIERESNESNNAINVQSIEVRRQSSLCQDRFDPNESSFSATPIDGGFYDDLTVCANDRDFYEFCLGENERLNINLQFIHQRGDVDINLLQQVNGSYTTVNGSYSTSNAEFVTIDTGTAECIQAEVYVCCGGERNTYSMEVEVLPVPPEERCALGLEPNDSRPEARPINQALNRDDLSLCPISDVDVYSIRVPAGDRITVGALGRTEFAQMDLQIYDEAGNFITSAFGNNPTATLQARRSDALYYMELRNNGGNQRALRYDVFLNAF